MENTGEDMTSGEIESGESSGMNRRNLIKTGAAVGAAAWVLPQVVSMSSALASGIPPACSYSVFENFHGLPAGAPSPNFQTYSGVGTPLLNGWVTSPGTSSVDGVVFVQYNTGVMDFTAPTPPVIIDLAGSPGPGGITKTFQVPCEGRYRVKFQRNIVDGGSFSLTITNVTGVPVVLATQNYSNLGVVYDSLAFSAAPGDSIEVTFFSPNTGNGNELVGNILVENL
jgi:hypothetical protein